MHTAHVFSEGLVSWTMLDDTGDQVGTLEAGKSHLFYAKLQQLRQKPLSKQQWLLYTIILAYPLY